MAQLIKDPTPIRKLLEARGMTEAELSRRTGFHKMKVNRALSGKRGVYLSDLIKIAEAIGVEWPTLLPVFGIADPTASNEMGDEAAFAGLLAETNAVYKRIARLERAVFGSGK